MVEKAEVLPYNIYNFLDIPPGDINLEEFEKNNKVFCREYEKKSYVYVDDESALKEITNTIITNHRKIGVDIEQSFKDSYSGYICLVQISTTDADYIFDILALKEHANHYLSKIFEEGSIIKIFYAGDGDLSWIYRDFKLRVKNYCDVKSLLQFYDKKAECSLVYLINEFCKYGFDKKEKKRLQVSDWWKRPLDEEQKEYASLDSHFLIYIRYCLLKKIIEKNNILVNGFSELIKSEQAKTEKEFVDRAFDKKKCLDAFNDIFKKKKRENTKTKEGEEVIPNDWNPNLKANCLKTFYVLSKEREVIGKSKNKNVDDVFSNELMIKIALNKAGWGSALKDMNNEDSKNFVLYKKIIDEALLKVDEEGDFNGEEFKSSEFSRRQEKEILKEKREKKQERMKKFVENYTQKSPVYENCSLEAPNGQILCHCDRKKIDWYVSRNLATLIKEIPPTARLNFEPSGEGFSLEEKDNLFYISDRQNLCVVCGNSKTYLKYHIVPSLYRQHLPHCYKSHRSHDVVLLCPRCHEKANQEADKLKVQLSEKYKVPLFSYSQQHILRQKLIQLSRSVYALRKNEEQLPNEYRKKLKEQIREFYTEISLIPEIQLKIPFKAIEEIEKTKKSKKIKLTNEFLDFCESLINFKNMVKEKSLKDFRNQHGKLLVDLLVTDKEKRDFILMWRMFFLEKMSPNYLPHSWNIHHSFERKFGEASTFYLEEEEKT